MAAAVGFNAKNFSSIQEPPTQLDGLSKKVLQAAKRSFSFDCGQNNQLKREIADLSPVQMKELLDTITVKIKGEKKVEQIVDRLAEMIPLDQLQQAIRIEYPKHVDALQTAKSLFREAAYSIRVSEEFKPTLRSRLIAILDAIVAAIESFVNAFGIANFFKTPDTAIEAEWKGQKIMMLLSLFSTLSTLVVSISGVAKGSMIAAGILLGVCLLSLIFPLIRPPAKFLPKAQNWTKQYLAGNLDVVEGRKEILDEIARTFIATKNAKSHVLLLGKTGVGKTETAKALTQAVARGDYPELKGKQLFYFNSADLIHGGDKILTRISELMGRHRDQFILIFDEIHLLCQRREKSAIADQLKTLLDQGTDSFPYVIGITTEEEYFRDIYVSNAAFARRFKRLTIMNTEALETEKILNNSLLKKAPRTILEQGAIQALMQKTAAAFGEQRAEPATSLKILSQCIRRCEQSEKSPLEIRVDQLRNQISALCSKGAVHQGHHLLPYDRENQIQALENMLSRLEQDLLSEKQEMDQLFNARDQLAKIKLATFQAVIKTAPLSQQILSNKERNRLGALLLHSHFLAPALEAEVRAKAKQLGVNAVINESLIQQVIDEELENNRRAQEAIELGRRQIASRQAG